MSPGPATRRFVVASANPDKVREIESVMRDAIEGVELVPRPADVDEVIEDGSTLVDNARRKAVALMAATGTASIADDTGLFITALDDAPGIFAARFAGEHATYADNCAKVLSELERTGAVDPEQRAARFVTVAYVAFPDGTQYWTEGIVEGTIAAAPRGAGGFGYDPIFSPAGLGGRTFAELGSELKNELSHRARAFRSLVARLQAPR